MAKGDFHTHSNASDGILTPTQLVELAAGQGVHYHALTDHDSTEGIAEAQTASARFPSHTLIPGVEMGTDIAGAEVHMLGLYLSPDDADLQGTLRRLRDGRLGRAECIVNKLRAMGMLIEWSRVQEIAGDASVGRPHIAHALVEKQYVDSIADAFDKYINRNGPAYCEREKMTPEESVQQILKHGGLACWAHPADIDDLDGHLARLKAAGMQALEVFYKNYPPDTVERLRLAAERFDLIPLGGSDYHGIHNDERMPGDIPLPDSSVERLLQFARTLPNRELVK